MPSKTFRILFQFTFSKSVINFLELKSLKFRSQMSFFEICVIVQLGIIKNCTWWSDIGETRLPAIQSSFITLLEMVSITVWLRLVNLVGEVMLGRRLVENMISRKSESFLFESHF